MWSAGYNVEEGYTFGYYLEQDPVWMELGALAKGIAVPSILATHPLRLIDFGCGQGVSLALIAACRPDIDCVGIDFHPAHVAHAKALARHAGLRNVTFYEWDFRHLAESWPSELGTFTYASAHGVQTWIAPDIAESLVRCYERSLVPGGLLYVGYNCWPGWLSLAPLQHLWAYWFAARGLSSARAVQLGLARMAELVQASPLLGQALPSLSASVRELGRRHPTYLAQEFLNAHWRPLWFDEAHAQFSRAKLTYVGSAAPQEWFLLEMLPEAMRNIVSRAENAVERELLCDLLANRAFRRDLWAKGTPSLTEMEIRRTLEQITFCGIQEPAQPKDERGPYRYPTLLGEVVGKPEIYAETYRPLFSGPVRFADLVHGAAPLEVLQRIGFAVSVGHVGVFRPLSDPLPAIRLNRHMAKIALHGGPYRFQIAIDVPHVMMLSDLEIAFVALYRDFGIRHEDHLGDELASIKARQGQRLHLEDGRVVEKEDEMRRALRQQARLFLDQRVPVLRRLGLFHGAVQATNTA